MQRLCLRPGQNPRAGSLKRLKWRRSQPYAMSMQHSAYSAALGQPEVVERIMAQVKVMDRCEPSPPFQRLEYGGRLLLDSFKGSAYSV